MAISENKKNLIRFLYIFSLLIVFGVAVTAIVHLKNDTGTYKNLEILLTVLSLITVFVITTHMDSFLTLYVSKYPPSLLIFKILSLIAFGGLVLGIPSYCYQTDDLDKSDVKGKIKTYSVVISIFGVLAIGLYFLMRGYGFGPDSKISSSSADKNKGYKEFVKNQIISNIEETCKDGKITTDQKEAYGKIKASLKTTTDGKKLDKLFQYCSFLYNSKLTYKLNNAASVYGPYNYPAIADGKKTDSVNLQNLYEYLTTPDSDYNMIDPSVENPSIVPNTRKDLGGVKINTDTDWGQYSQKLAQYFNLTGSKQEITDLLEKPFGNLKLKYNCQDLIKFFPVTLTGKIFAKQGLEICGK